MLDDGVMLKSQANLFASKTANWSGAHAGLANDMVVSLAKVLQKSSDDGDVKEQASSVATQFSSLLS